MANKTEQPTKEQLLDLLKDLHFTQRVWVLKELTTNVKKEAEFLTEQGSEAMTVLNYISGNNVQTN